MAGMEGERPQRKEDVFNADSPGGDIPLGREECGNLYADIGLSSAEFGEGVAEMRRKLDQGRREFERARPSERFNSAEFMRELISTEVGQMLKTGKYKKEELLRFGRRVQRGWDAIVYHLYGEKVQKNAVTFFWVFGHKDQVEVDRAGAAMLDVMATALAVPHTPGQQIISICPQAINDVKKEIEIQKANGVQILRQKHIRYAEKLSKM